MKNKIKNHVLLGYLPSRFSYYCYVDTKEHLADDILAKHKIHIKFRKVVDKKDADYCFVVCRIPKKQDNVFQTAMDELSDKMAISNHEDYENFCNQVMKYVYGRPW